MFFKREKPSFCRRQRQKEEYNEHYEERLDEWVDPPGAINYASNNLGQLEGFGGKENFRRIDGDLLYFWEKAINLAEVCEWVKKVKKCCVI